jgi:hypothetical protein
MARETVGIHLSQDPLWEASAAFLAVLAHPSDDAHRILFHQALCRSTILAMAKCDAVFAWSPQALKPGYFLMDESACSVALKQGGAELAEREAAAVSVGPLFDAALPGASAGALKFQGIAYSNTAYHRHYLVNLWRGADNTEATIKKVATRIEAPARPVIHAVYALWKMVLLLRNNGVPDDSMALQVILTQREALSVVIDFAEQCRTLAPGIPALKVAEADLIQFVAT